MREERSTAAQRFWADRQTDHRQGHEKAEAGAQGSDRTRRRHGSLDAET